MNSYSFLFRFIPATLLVLLVLFVGGCGEIRDDDTDLPVTSTATLDKVLQYQQQGKYAEAAALLLQLAKSASPELGFQYQIQAIDNLLKASQIESAKKLLQTIQVDADKPVLRIRLNQSLAKIYLSENQPEKVLELLVTDNTLPDPVRAMTHELRARAWQASGNTLEGARERILLEALLNDTDQINQNRDQIWNNLRQLTPVALQQLIINPPPDSLSGWMELVRISKTAINNPEQFETEISTWKLRYPGHSASTRIMEKLMSYYRAIKRPEKIALLLPLTGKLAKPAAAIRNGFLAAYYQSGQSHSRTRVRIYNTHKTGKTIEQIYQQAVTDGAEIIIGPLDKNKVARLAQLQPLPVPVITLNQTELAQPGNTNFIQFGLSPEDEARQIAERASLEGLIRVAVITPKGEWGDRLTRAFSQRFKELGGIILKVTRYDFRNSDMSTPIQALLNLNESQLRYQRIKDSLPTEVKFEPRRRQDIDFIFMAAFQRQARLITPQLRFHHAADIPVYSTSHAYNGQENIPANRDMNGVTLCDIPWLISPDYQQDPMYQQFLSLWPQEVANYSRLYALGIDSYHLPGQIKWLQNNPNEHYAGITGRLYLNGQNQIQRLLKWGRFSRGRVTPLSDIQPPASTLPDTDPVTPSATP